MSKVEQVNRVWVIRAGQRGEAHDLFLKRGTIALADAKLGNLAKLKPIREAFYAAYRKWHPDESRTGSAGIGGKYFRFAVEVQVGDLVVYPSLMDKAVIVGEVTGDYLFVETADFQHQRPVQWKYAIPKAAFSQVAQYELGAARTFFEFKKNVRELIRKMKEYPAVLTS